MIRPCWHYALSPHGPRTWSLLQIVCPIVPTRLLKYTETKVFCFNLKQVANDPMHICNPPMRCQPLRALNPTPTSQPKETLQEWARSASCRFDEGRNALPYAPNAVKTRSLFFSMFSFSYTVAIALLPASKQSSPSDAHEQRAAIQFNQIFYSSTQISVHRYTKFTLTIQLMDLYAVQNKNVQVKDMSCKITLNLNIGI